MTDLKEMQTKHSKINTILYTRLEMQEYIRSGNMNKNVTATLVALRSHTVKQIKDNFHTYYKSNLQCVLCNDALDTQEHCMSCPILLDKVDTPIKVVKYNFIYGTPDQQKEIASYYQKLLEVRNNLLEEEECRPGAHTGP